MRHANVIPMGVSDRVCANRSSVRPSPHPTLTLPTLTPPTEAKDSRTRYAKIAEMTPFTRNEASAASSSTDQVGQPGCRFKLACVAM